MLLSTLYRNELFDEIIPFWETYSLDSVNGGYYSCLTPGGDVFDTDKFVWLLGRQAWLFAMLYNNVEKKAKWLDIAKSGVDFLIKHCKAKNGRFYFSVTAQGQPLVAAYNIFSDCFAAMAFSQYAKASGDKAVEVLAQSTYRNILRLKDNPKEQFEKNIGNRPLRGFSLPMILSNLVLEMEEVLSPEEVNSTLDFSVQQVMDVFRDTKTGLIFENVLPQGRHHNSFDGRLINPGHGIEAMWFMIDIGVRRNDKALIAQATETILTTLNFSWDKKYGGIYYFMDAQGFPPQQLEWDQKLWWVHLETLVALAKSYEQTQRTDVLQWYKKLHTYTWSHFKDPKGGEWYGYLNRQGEVFLNLKGGKWKGCFHVPRACYQCWHSFEKIETKTQLQLEL